MSRLKLLIAIPALQRGGEHRGDHRATLAARARILAEIAGDRGGASPWSATGRRTGPSSAPGATATRIELIVFERNRGYGAAIKEAWRQSDAELLALPRR